MLADTPEAVLAAVLSGYDPAARSAARLECRRRLAETMAADFQAREIRAAENGDLGEPWALVAQGRLVRRALTADRSAPPSEYINIWPANQPRLVLGAHLVARYQVPKGNVLILDPGTARTFLHSLVRAGALSWRQV